jgi:para-nitrobenzyl esterase
MQHSHRFCLIAGLALLLAGRAALAQIDSAAITGGHVQGTVTDSIAAFKGIPFAAPPVGALRWKAPQPVQAWAQVRKADAYGPSCMQAASMTKIMGAGPALSEDCLI